MATADVVNITRVPCRITVDGVQIGNTRAIRFMPNVRYQSITAEEFGHTPNKIVYVGQAPMIACIVRDWDAKAFSAIFPDSSSGNGTTTAPKTGSDMKAKSCVLAIVPLQSGHPGVTFHNAIPMLDQSAALQFGYNSDLGMAAVFAALPDSSGKTYTIS